MKFSFLGKRKAQSATEYLMTYGWAILAIAIVGALLYTTVFSQSNCADAAATGFPVVNSLTPVENQFQVYADGSAKMIIKNNLDKTVILQSFTADGVAVTGITQSINPGATYEIPVATLVAGTFAGGTQGNCFSGIDVAMTYDVNGGLTGMKSTGKLGGKYY